MPDVIDAVVKTREATGKIFAVSLAEIENLSEKEVAEKILQETKNYPSLFPEGYYNPPPEGVAVIFDQEPFKRLNYDSLRLPEFWPSSALKFNNETVGLIYFSPLDKETNMLGDMGCTIYRGENAEIKEHIKKCYDAMLAIAKHTKVGMSFSDICSFTTDFINDKFTLSRWITRNSNPMGMNLGHTIPGSYEPQDFGKSFEEIKETITKKRIFIKENVDFKIPETCAFTIESRFEDAHKQYLPSVHFHFIVCFKKGKKTIIEGFEEIFSAVGMDYMQTKQ